MEQMLQSAGALLIQALPTFFVVVLLHWYLKTMLFQPLERTLAERHAATQGAREKAAAALQAAERKVAEYDEKLREAKGKIYQEQETWRKQTLDSQNAILAKAREENLSQIAQAKTAIQGEVIAARTALQSEAESLSKQIVAAVLKGSRN
jgi:F-type H+-transporting ATPase subunit b